VFNLGSPTNDSIICEFNESITTAAFVFRALLGCNPPRHLALLDKINVKIPPSVLNFQSGLTGLGPDVCAIVGRFFMVPPQHAVLASVQKLMDIISLVDVSAGPGYYSEPAQWESLTVTRED
jgi:hypothetical protein